MTIVEDARIIEGTWEEIAARADELKGRHVQLVVRNGNTPRPMGVAQEPRRETLTEAFTRIGTVGFLPTDAAARSRELWEQGVDEKHRRIKEKRRQA